MASVLHRTTRQYIPSANTPDYSVIDWIINPDLSAVVGFETKYWIITGDIVTLMDAAARDAVDAAELEASRDATVAELDQIEALLRAFAGVLKDEINILRAQHAFADRTLLQLRTAIRNKLGT